MDNQHRLLLVDDEPNLLYLLKEALSRDGYAITTAKNGFEAVALLKEDLFDLVLVDLQMPGIDGLGVMNVAKTCANNPAIIMLTAHGSLESAIMALRIGAVDYLLKPSSNKVVRDCVQRALERREQELTKERDSQRLSQIKRLITTGLDSPTETVTPPTDPGALLPTAWALSSQENAPGSIPSPIIKQVEEKEEAVLLVVGDLSVDVTRHQALLQNYLLELTPSEFSLLVVLMANVDRVLPCRSLVKAVQGYECSEIEARAIIKPHINHLRQKLLTVRNGDRKETDYIVNVRGVGYRLLYPADSHIKLNQ